MVTVYVVQTGQTTWQQQDRIETAEGAPLTPDGVEHAREVLARLNESAVTAVYAPRGEAERQTAALLAGELTARVRTAKGLHEFDYGLWQGLLRDEVRRRHPKIFKKWHRDPGSVRPPEGETLAEARQRLMEGLRGILKRHKQGSIALVLRPIAAGLVRGILADGGADDPWSHVDFSAGCRSYEVAGNGKSIPHPARTG